jgi:hypothetical protein
MHRVPLAVLLFIGKLGIFCIFSTLSIIYGSDHLLAQSDLALSLIRLFACSEFQFIIGLELTINIP